LRTPFEMKPGAVGPPWTVRCGVLSRARILEYERSLRPCLALAQDAPTTTHHSEMGSEKVAVVVPVLDEAETLPALLADLDAQQPTVEEIVVVDAGSTDGTLELLRAHGSLRLVEAPGATPGRGRNTCGSAASCHVHARCAQPRRR